MVTARHDDGTYSVRVNDGHGGQEWENVAVRIFAKHRSDPCRRHEPLKIADTLMLIPSPSLARYSC